MTPPLQGEGRGVWPLLGGREAQGYVTGYLLVRAPTLAGRLPRCQPFLLACQRKQVDPTWPAEAARLCPLHCKLPQGTRVVGCSFHAHTRQPYPASSALLTWRGGLACRNTASLKPPRQEHTLLILFLLTLMTFCPPRPTHEEGPISAFPCRPRTPRCAKEQQGVTEVWPHPHQARVVRDGGEAGAGWQAASGTPHKASYWWG